MKARLSVTLTVTATDTRKSLIKRRDGNGQRNICWHVHQREGAIQFEELNPNATLVFSSLSFTTYEVGVNGRSVINVSLSPDSKVLQGVVVVGYGTQKKKNVQGAVGSVKFNQDINSRPMVEFGHALSGKVAGVEKESVLEVKNLAGVNAANSNHQEFYAPWHFAFHLPGSTENVLGQGFNTPTNDIFNELEANDLSEKLHLLIPAL